MKRWMVLLVGVVTYVAFLGAFLYAIGFLGNFLVPKSIDSPTGTGLVEALLVNGGLLLLFGLQHSVMARPSFKQWWTQFVPKPLERPIYVLATSIALAIIYWQWRSMGTTVWEVQNIFAVSLLYGVFAVGWLLVLVSTFLINHFDLFGLRQVWLYFRGRKYTPVDLATPWPYRVIRHPLYLGWLTAFWATPTMTVGHLVFAIGTTAYIFVAIKFEERNLATEHGKPYREYRDRVPMLVPGFKRNGKPAEPAGDSSVATV